MATWTARMTSKGRLTIPAGARRHLGIGPGDTVEWVHLDGRIVLRKKSDNEQLSETAGETSASAVLTQSKDEKDDVHGGL